MQQGEYKGNQEIREEFPIEWFQLAEEQSPEHKLLQGGICQNKDQYPGDPWDYSGKWQVLNFEHKSGHGDGAGYRNDESNQSDNEAQL